MYSYCFVIYYLSYSLTSSIDEQIKRLRRLNWLRCEICTCAQKYAKFCFNAQLELLVRTFLQTKATKGAVRTEQSFTYCPASLTIATYNVHIVSLSYPSIMDACSCPSLCQFINLCLYLYILASPWAFSVQFTCWTVSGVAWHDK